MEGGRALCTPSPPARFRFKGSLLRQDANVRIGPLGRHWPHRIILFRNRRQIASSRRFPAAWELRRRRNSAAAADLLEPDWSACRIGDPRAVPTAHHGVDAVALFFE